MKASTHNVSKTYIILSLNISAWVTSTIFFPHDSTVLYNISKLLLSISLFWLRPLVTEMSYAERKYFFLSLSLLLHFPNIKLSVEVPLFSVQGSLQEQDDSEPDSSLSQSPNVQDWLSQARSTRTQQHHNNLLRQRVRGSWTAEPLSCLFTC